VLRAGSGTHARYSSTLFFATLRFAERRVPEFVFFIGVYSPKSRIVYFEKRKRARKKLEYSERTGRARSGQTLIEFASRRCLKLPT